MKSARGRFGLKFFLVVAFLAASQVHAAVSCHKINAKGVGQDRGGGVTEARSLAEGFCTGPRWGVYDHGRHSARSIVLRDRHLYDQTRNFDRHGSGDF